MSLKYNQSGSGPIEVILIIVVVALVGAVGWLVYDRQSDKEPSAANTSEVSKDKEAPKASTYLEIKEWGVKIPLSDEYAAATYSIDTGPGIAASGYARISIDGDEVGGFDRYKMGDTVYSPAGDDMGKFDQADLDGSPDTYTKVGDYYYSFMTSQAAVTDKQDAFRDYLADARKNLEAI